MKNFVQIGKILTCTAPAGGVVSGNFVVIGSLFGTASTTAVEGEEFELETGGVFEQPKVAAEAWDVGDPVYYDSGARLFTSVVGSNLKVGVAAATAANPSGYGAIRFNDNF